MRSLTTFVRYVLRTLLTCSALERRRPETVPGLSQALKHCVEKVKKKMTEIAI